MSIQDVIREQVTKHPVVLYMKGTPDFPQCGFSANAIGVLRASGALDHALGAIRMVVEAGGFDSRFIDAMPTALVKPFSGSAARAMLIETMNTHGVDSFPALVAATVQGSTETTFYVLAVYFGAVGIQRARHAVGCALIADLAGVLAAIGVCYWFFG